ncbi:MAG: hypothetical protein K1X72_06190 [Pyrinomonadaceae bacterium]|nr:hypothetical protein [Pyrinomonadaceae bacterium]
MNKIPLRFSILLITFVIGISFVVGWFYYQDSQKSQIILPNSRWEQIFFNGTEDRKFGTINQTANLGGLMELRKTIVKKGNLEIRIWRGFGREPLEGVVFKQTDNHWSGLHLIETDIDKVEVENLSPPKSGWESFWQQLVDKEILTLRDSSEIKCGEAGIDGVSYVVEINQNKIYRTYMLSLSDYDGNCHEVKQIEDISSLIGEEFDSKNQECKRDEWFACTKLNKSFRQK